MMSSGILCCVLSCAPLSQNNNNSSSTYIFLSHTRTSTNDRIFKKVYDLNLELYEMTLLGGDLGVDSFQDDFINHIDSIFNLKSKNTLWSVGNHDVTTNENFKNLTGKNKYHSYKTNNTTFITLDTQDSLSNIVGKQKQYFLDILKNTSSKNIIIISHKLIFMDQHPIMDGQINKVCNGPKGKCDYCHNRNNFQHEIYPELVKLKEKGINIIWIGGDLGYKTSSFEYKDLNGIIFLGNGFWFKNKENKVLVLSEDKSSIKYKFVFIDSLIKNQTKEYINHLFEE